MKKKISKDIIENQSKKTVDSMINGMESLSQTLTSVGETMGAFAKLSKDLRKIKKNMQTQYEYGKEKSKSRR